MSSVHSSTVSHAGCRFETVHWYKTNPCWGAAKHYFCIFQPSAGSMLYFLQAFQTSGFTFHIVADWSTDTAWAEKRQVLVMHEGRLKSSVSSQINRSIKITCFTAAKFTIYRIQLYVLIKIFLFSCCQTADQHLMLLINSLSSQLISKL